jgi:hypothetical protein
MPADTRRVVRWRSSSVRADRQIFGSHLGATSYRLRRHLRAHREAQLGPVQSIYIGLSGLVSNRFGVA